MRALLLLLSLLPAPAPPEVKSAAGLDTLTLTWDPNVPTDNVTGYLVLRGPADCRAWTETIDVGNVTSYTWPVGQLNLSTPMCFSAIAVNAIGRSAPAAPATWMPTADLLCAPPLGANAVSLFAGRVVSTSGSVGSRLFVQFQAASTPAITRLTVNVNGVPQRDVPGENLTDVGSLWFRAPAIAGTYPLTVVAINAAGCTTTLVNGADGKPLTVKVK